MRKRVRTGEMPPKGEAPLAAADRDALLAWLDAALGPEGRGAGHDEDVMRRLNRREYANTIRDLFGVPIESDELPADEIGHNFDTIGAVLSTSRLLVEAAALAERVASFRDAARSARAAEGARGQRADVRRQGQRRAAGSRGGLYSNGEVSLTRKLPRAGDYVLRLRAHGDQAGSGSVPAGGEGRDARGDPRRRARARARRAHRRGLRAPARGIDEFAVAFDDFWAPDAADPKARDHNLVLEWFEIEGPLDQPEPSLSARSRRTRGSRCATWSGTCCAGRGAARPDEIARVVDLAAKAPTFEERVRTAIVVADVAELPVQTGGADRTPPETTKASDALRLEKRVPTLDEHAVAARLAYFLWSSTPDRELDEQSDAGGELRLRQCGA